MPAPNSRRFSSSLYAVSVLFRRAKKVTNPELNRFIFVNRSLRLDVHDLLKQVRISRVLFLYKCTHSIKSRESATTVVDNLAYT